MGGGWQELLMRQGSESELPMRAGEASNHPQLVQSVTRRYLSHLEAAVSTVCPLRDGTALTRETTRMLDTPR